MDRPTSSLDSSLAESLTDGEENHSQAAQVSLASDSPGVTLVQLPDGETVQVQEVFQTPQTSVIQTVQQEAAELEKAGLDVQRRRENLSRRPSYRKILSELSSDSPAVPKIQEEQTDEEVDNTDRTTSIYQTSSGQYIAVGQGRAVQLTSPGVGTLQVGSTFTPQPGATVLQCAAQTAESSQQFYLQGGQVLIQAATGDMPAYQLRSPNSSLAQSIVMAASPGAVPSPSSQHAEEITRKREVRLMKNREAARECRRKKKEYVKCLENRVAVLENQNKTLIEELKALKDIYCHKAE